MRYRYNGPSAGMVGCLLILIVCGFYGVVVGTVLYLAWLVVQWLISK